MDRTVVVRFLALLLGALASAFAAGFVVVPMPWRDPFVFMIWIRVTLLGAAIGFAYSAFTLWDTKLGFTVPIVMATTILAAFCAGRMFLPSSPVAAFVTGLAAMGWCRRNVTPGRAASDQRAV